MSTTITADHDAKRLALQASVFGRLSPPQLDGVARVSDARHVRAGSILCTEGECTQEAFVIADGSVAVLAGGARVAQYGPGDIVGDWALFGDGRRAATVCAVTDVDVVVVDGREVHSLLMAVPAASRALGPRPSAES